MIRIFIPFLLALFLFSCGGSADKNASEAPAENTLQQSIAMPSFSQDSAFAFVARQVEFGPRVPNTPAHRACRNDLILILKKYCDTVYVQDFKARAWDGTLLELTNIIGSFRPESPARMLIAAHWDSRPYADHDPDSAFHDQPIDGANDGASGVGVILELARLMHQQAPPRGVDLILFDGEDYGEPRGQELGTHEFWALGSTHWARQPHRKAYTAHFGIVLDMVGVPDPQFTLEGTSMYFAPDVMRAVWDRAARLGYGKWFVKKETTPIVDDHLPVNQIAGIPCIDIIHRETGGESGFFKYWHTRQDNLENVDPASLGMTGRLMVSVIYEGL